MRQGQQLQRQVFRGSRTGTRDKDVLTSGNDAKSLLLTCDKDFGELVFRQHLVSSGVVLVRLEGLSGASNASTVVEAMKTHHSEMVGSFTVISPGILRIRHREPPQKPSRS